MWVTNSGILIFLTSKGNENWFENSDSLRDQQLNDSVRLEKKGSNFWFQLGLRNHNSTVCILTLSLHKHDIKTLFQSSLFTDSPIGIV